MSPAASKSVVPPVEKGRHRKWTVEMAQEVAHYRANHEYSETIKRYRLGSAQIKRLLAMAAGKSVPAKGNGSAPRQTYLLARKLKEAVGERLRRGSELTDVEIYATLLTRQLLDDQ
jgi:hypothetical protein